jgi:iron complex outermembrane receptor protein
VYLSYTRGFRAGGVNPQRYPANSGIRQTFDPEYSDNFELGYKVGNAKGTFRMTAALFYISWKDLQFFNLAAPNTYARSNVGDASSYGLELEGSWIPLKGLQVDASLGLNKTEYADFNIVRQPFGQPEIVTPIGGNSLSNAPGHTVFLGVQYTVPLSKRIDAMIRGEFRNLGSYYTDIQNTIEQPAYSLLNARAGLTMGKLGLFVWGQNITNTTYMAFGTADTSFGTSLIMAAPATFGVTLQAGF